jgi:hypothetical protein
MKPAAVDVLDLDLGLDAAAFEVVLRQVGHQPRRPT